MVVESSAIFIRRTWHSWLRGIVSGLAFYLLMMSSIGAALAFDLIEHGTFSLKIVRLDWLLLLCLFSELVSRVAQASYSVPLFFWTAARIEAAGDAIELDLKGRSVRLTYREILGGWTTSHEDSPVLVLHTTGRTTFIQVPDESTAMTMLEQAGAGAKQRMLSMRLTRSPHWSWWEALATRLLGSAGRGRGLAQAVAMGVLAYATNMLSGWGWLACLVTAAWATSVMSALLKAVNLLVTRVRVGTDGFAVARLGQQEFISAAQIARASRRDETVHVDLRDGRQFALGAPNAKAAAILVDRIRAGIETNNVRGPASEHIGALARRGRPVREWLGAVRRTAEVAGSYRSGWMDGCDLVAMVGDSRADPEQRVAAAAALSARSDSEVRSRLRIALDACADEPVRIAIDKVLDGELEAAEIERIVAAEASARAS